MVEAWDYVPVSGTENACYYYSTYNAKDKTTVSSRKKVMVLAAVPTASARVLNLITAVSMPPLPCGRWDMRQLWLTATRKPSPRTMIPRQAYFEPLTVEDVVSIYEKEKPLGVIVQFGGQTPLNIAEELEKAGVKILGTTVESIDIASDRGRLARSW